MDGTQPTTTHDDTGDDWLMPPAETEASPDADRPAATRGRRQWLAGGGLVAAGAVAGAVIFTAVGADGSAPQAGQFTPTGSIPGALPGGPGLGVGPTDGSTGLDGEQRLPGILTAVGDSTITVKTATGTTMYTVTGQTQILRNGASASLGELQTGDPVLVHVYPSGSGDTMLAERVFAGELPAFGGPPGLEGDDDGPPGTSDDHGGRTT